MSDIQEKIRQQISSNPIVLYMKGTPTFPQCGFSGKAAHLLAQCGVKQYFSVNVLMDPEVREGIKVYSNWPTIPQLYIDGQFIGGSDIMTELFESGELEKMVKKAV